MAHSLSAPYRLCFVAAMIAATVPFVVAAQSTTPDSSKATFEVASIKEDKALGTGGDMRIRPDGGISVRHMSARALVTIAYQLNGYQLIAAPSWMAETYYDIDAKPADAATRDQTFAMFEALLVDRFKLTFHHETRELGGFSLMQARPGTLGPSLRRSPYDCEHAFGKTPQCKNGQISGSSLKMIGSPLWSLVKVIIGEVGAPVSDDTQLTGTFDVDLQWSREVAPSDDLRSIYTSLQEQLGLKLERKRVPVEVFVIDRVERPSAD